jgi:adenylate cyclase
MGVDDLYRSWIRPVINLGVTERTRPENVKHIQLLNTAAIFELVLFGLRLVGELLRSLGPDAGGLLKGFYINHIPVSLTIVAMLAVLVLSKTGRHSTAAMLFGTAVVFFQSCMTIFFDEKGALGYVNFIPMVIVAILIFPPGKWKKMLAMVGFISFCLVATMIAKNLVTPFYARPQPSLTVYNNFLIFFSFCAMMALGLVARAFIAASDERLKAEQDKVNQLSEKLRAYLPHQFVEALAGDHKNSLPDHRRRRLTIFFSDVQGFTRWTDRLDPEEVRQILNRYLSEMSKIAHKWGGTVDKFIGDALMIFFGDPQYLDDRRHALDCVKMALEMQSRLDGLRKEWCGQGYEDTLHIRVGINTGYATVGNFGSEERLSYTAVGGAVNLASRLETVSQPDRITVSQSTYLLVNDEIDCQLQGEIRLKGLPEPIKIYEVVGVKTH